MSDDLQALDRVRRFEDGGEMPHCGLVDPMDVWAFFGVPYGRLSDGDVNRNVNVMQDEPSAGRRSSLARFGAPCGVPVIPVEHDASSCRERPQGVAPHGIGARGDLRGVIRMVVRESVQPEHPLIAS